MMPIFLRTLRRNLWTMIGWGVGLGLLSAYTILLFDAIVEQQAQLMQLMASYPSELLSIFGDMSKIYTPEGYLTYAYFSYMPLILGFAALLGAAGLIAADEENGTLDLLLSYPVSRSGFFWGRVLGFLAVYAVILMIIWAGFAAFINQTQMDLSAGELFLPFISLFAVLVFFMGVSLLLSVLVPSRAAAGTICSLLLVESFLIEALARMDKRVGNLVHFSPLHYFQAGEAVNGLDFKWLGILLGFGLALILCAWGFFVRKDIRTGGEGSWSMALRRKAKPVP